MTGDASHVSDRPLRLAVEGLGATVGPTDGAGRYLSGLLTALGRRSDVSTSAYVGPSMGEHARRIPGLDRVVILPTRSRSTRVLAQHLLVPALSRHDRVDVVVCPSNYMPTVPLRPTVAIVQNMFLAQPTRAPGRVRALYRRYMRALIATRARAVVAVSFTMAHELERAAPRLAGQVHVVYPPLDSKFLLSSAAQNQRPTWPYFLAVGTVWRHRNYDLAIQALARAPVPHRLVIAGATPSKETGRLRYLAEALGVSDRVQFLGVVAAEAMPDWYSGATALVSTSRLESFGLSVIEAMAAQVPVIAVRRTVYEETAGDAGLLVDPTPQALAQAMVEVTRSETRDRLIAKGKERATLFSYGRYTDQLVAICRAAVEGSAPDRGETPAT